MRQPRGNQGESPYVLVVGETNTFIEVGSIVVGGSVAMRGAEIIGSLFPLRVMEPKENLHGGSGY